MSTLKEPVIEQRFSSFPAIVTTYIVRVDHNHTVEMSGDQADLDKILAAMRMMREDYTVSEFVSDWQEWINRHDGDTVEALRVALFQRDTAYEEVKQLLHERWNAELETSKVDRLSGVDYVQGTEEHGVVGSLDLLNLLHPETAGLAMCQAITKAWPDAGQDRIDLLELARQYISGHDYPERHTFLSVFSYARSKYSPAIWSALMGAASSKGENKAL